MQNVGTAALILYASLLPARQEKRKYGVPSVTLLECLVIVICIVILGYVIWKIIEFCDDYLGRGTNQPRRITNYTYAAEQAAQTNGVKLMPTPLIHQTKSGTTVAMQMTDGFSPGRQWVDTLFYSYQHLGNGLVEVVCSDANEVLFRVTVPIQMGEESPYVIADFSSQSKAYFDTHPVPAAGAIRLLSHPQ